MAFPRKKKKKSAKLKLSNPAILPGVPEPAIPDHFRCPISLDLMKDPVAAPTGITYDRDKIEKWLHAGNSTCPVTNTPLAAEDLIPNHTIRRAIQCWCVSNRAFGLERIPTPRIPIGSSAAVEILSNIYLASRRRDVHQCLELVRKMRSLEKESERNRLCFVSSGAPVVIASVFRTLAAEPLEVLMEILAALAGLLLFFNDNLVSELGSPESLDSIIEIMQHGDATGRLNALMMVKKMASLSSGEAVLSDKNNLIEALFKIMKDSFTMQATKASMVAAFYLISGNKSTATKLVGMGIVPLIVELLVNSDKSMIEKTLAVLDALCGCDAGREAACAHALTIPAIATKILRVSDAVTEFTVSVVWKLCKECGGGCLSECLQAGVFQKLLLLLQVGCGEKTKERATKMLKMMTAYDEKLECVDLGDFKGLNRSL